MERFHKKLKTLKGTLHPSSKIEGIICIFVKWKEITPLFGCKIPPPLRNVLKILFPVHLVIYEY
jgi:hypothetical protein